MIKGESYTIEIVFNAEYDISRIEEIQLAVNYIVVGSLKSDTIIPNTINTYLCQIPGNITDTFKIGNNIISLYLDDSIRGIIKKNVSSLNVDRALNVNTDESINTGVNMLINVTVGETDVTTEYVYFDAIRGKDAYESYLATTTDNPPLSEEEWISSIELTKEKIDDKIGANSGGDSTKAYNQKGEWTSFAPALTDDENYITDLEKLNLHAPGSDNQIASDFDIKDLTDSTSLRNTWSAKQDALGFTPENISNKKNTLTNSDTDYPTTNAVNIGLSNKVDKIENYSLISDTDIDRLSYTSGVNTGDQDLSNLLSLQHLSDFNHADIVHQNRIALDSVSGINTGDQDLSGLATKSEMTSGLLLKVDKEAGKGLSTEDYTTAEKNKVANVPLNTNAELGLKVDKIVGNSLVPDEDIITLQNTSGINTGDQLADNETITGSGKSNDPFIANIKIIESEIPPSNPIQGLRWFNLTNGIEYTYIQDTWIDLNGNTFLSVDHESLIDKNSEADFQHINTTITKPALDAADMVAIKDSVTGKVVLTPKSNLQTDLTNVNQAITNLQNNKADKTQEAWITPTLLNGWVNIAGETTRYMKDNFGFVHLQVCVTGGTGASYIAQLPVGYRPLFNVTQVGLTSTSAQLYIIGSDGNIYPFTANPANKNRVNLIFKAEL